MYTLLSPLLCRLTGRANSSVSSHLQESVLSFMPSTETLYFLVDSGVAASSEEDDNCSSCTESELEAAEKVMSREVGREGFQMGCACLSSWTPLW